MITLRSLPQSPDAQLRQLGWNWMLGTDTLPYLVNEAVMVSTEQADAYAEAANELFEMLVAAGQHVIDRNRFAELGIPENLVDLIRYSWDDDRNILLYGRFDLVGPHSVGPHSVGPHSVGPRSVGPRSVGPRSVGPHSAGPDAISGSGEQGIKLIEFNADTATCLPETAVVQYAHLRANGLDEALQFNGLFETLVSQFTELKSQNSDLTPTLLLSAMRDVPEDDTNVALLGEAAREAGFEVAFAYVDEVEFSEQEGIYRFEQGAFTRYDFWFKLVPWEYIAQDEPELAQLLTQLVRQRRAVIINPAYSLLFQSKAILKVLWELYPDHPLLLRTETRPLAGQPSVEKVLFGREGANIRLLDAAGQATETAEGDYGDYPKVYQQYVDFPQDPAGHHYQAGVFFAGEACALGFRRGGRILDNTAQFVGHIITD